MPRKPGKPKARYKRKTNYAKTLCWDCQNAVPSRDGKRGCSWSRKLIPVDGWQAEPTEKRDSFDRVCASYLVKACPLFIPDEPRGNIQDYG